MNNKELTSKESLDIITRMIENTRRNIDHGEGNHLIRWGVSTLITALIVHTTVAITGNGLFHWLWMLIPIIGCTWTQLANKKRPQKVITHIDKMQTAIWSTILYMNIATPTAFAILWYFEIPIFMEYYKLFALLPLISILTTSIGFIVTGAIIRFRPIVIGGAVGMILGYATLHLPEYCTIIFALWALITMIIPGIKLNIFARHYNA